MCVQAKREDAAANSARLQRASTSSSHDSNPCITSCSSMSASLHVRVFEASNGGAFGPATEEEEEEVVAAAAAAPAIARPFAWSRGVVRVASRVNGRRRIAVEGVCGCTSQESTGRRHAREREMVSQSVPKLTNITFCAPVSRQRARQWRSNLDRL